MEAVELREYALKLDKFGISRDAYMELKYFCRQYDQKRREAASLLGVGSPAFDAGPKSNIPGRPTESAAIKRESLMRDVDMIDECAKAVDNGIWYHAIIDNCCRRVPWECLKPEDMGSSQKQAYFTARRQFFFLLHRARLERVG